MMMRKMREKFGKYLSKVPDFIKNQEGVAAIEFALVAPFIVVFMVGAINIFDGYQGAQAYQKAGTTVVDLVTRHDSEFDDDDRDVIFATAEALLGNYGGGTDYTISITSVENVFDSDDDPTLTVAWSEANVDSAKVTNAELVNYEIPNIPEGNSVILIEVTGSYEPYIAAGAFGSYDYSRYFIRRPRFLDTIDYSS